LKRKDLIHIGAPKTGSTSLQRGVLGNLEDVHHFGEFGDGVTSLEEESLIRSVLFDDDVFVREDEFARLFTKHRQRAGSRRLVFSSADVILGASPTTAARRLRKLASDESQVLIVVRNQPSALASFYTNHGAWLKPAPQPYYRRFVEPDAWLDFVMRTPSRSTLAGFSYWQALQPFIQYWGRDHVTAVAFELLVLGDSETWSIVADLLGTTPEIGYSLFTSFHERPRLNSTQVAYGRIVGLLNPFRSPPDVRALAGLTHELTRRGRKFEPSWRTDQLRRLDEIYSDGNLKLAQEFNLPLAELGYPVAGNPL